MRYPWKVVFVRLLMAGWMVCSFSGCKAFDRDRYRALLDGVGSEASVDDGAGTCLQRTARDDAGCVLAIVPPPPSTLTDQPTNGRTYTLALQRLEIGPGSFGNWNQIGFDLDRRCTAPTATLDQQSCLPQQIVADGIDGRDNAFGGAIATSLLVSQTLVDTEVTNELQTGRLALGLRITEWGGGDDRHVSVDWLTLTQGRPPEGSTSLTWDGRDRWMIDPGLSFAPGTTMPLVRSSDAFVACGYFVASFDARVPLAFLHRGRLRMLWVNLVKLAGAFDPAHGGTTDLIGLWTRTNIVDSLPWFDYCPPPIGPRNAFNDRVNAIAQAFDVLDDLSDNPTTPCNAATLALRMTWRPVTIEDVASTPFPQLNNCNSDGGAPVDP
jgi:hypothetical protein